MSDRGLLRAKSWYPQLAGIVVGLLQFPYMYFLQDSLGSATSFSVGASWAVNTVAPKQSNSHFRSFVQRGISALAQPMFLLGAVVGASTAAQLSQYQYTADGVGGLLSFLGGFCIVFGARIAGGCTSGHGISGFGELGINSMFTVPAMFASGIATAFTMRALGVYPYYVQ